MIKMFHEVIFVLPLKFTKQLVNASIYEATESSVIQVVVNFPHRLVISTRNKYPRKVAYFKAEVKSSIESQQNLFLLYPRSHGFQNSVRRTVVNISVH